MDSENFKMNVRRKTRAQLTKESVFLKRDAWNHLEKIHTFPCLIKGPNIFRVMDKTSVHHCFLMVSYIVAEWSVLVMNVVI